MNFEQQILASNPEERDWVRNVVSGEQQTVRDLTQESGLEPTEREGKLIDQAESLAKNVLEKYGISMGAIDAAPTPSVLLVEKGGVERLTEGRNYNGLSVTGKDLLVTERKDSDVRFLLTTAHEYLHLLKKPVYRIDHDEGRGNTVGMQRKGLAIWLKNGESYLDGMEEAVVSKLTEEDMYAYIRNSGEYREVVEKSDYAKGLVGNFFEKAKSDESLDIGDIDVPKIIHAELDEQTVQKVLDLNENLKSDSVGARKAAVANMLELLKSMEDADQIRVSHHGDLIGLLDRLCADLSTVLKEEYPAKEDVWKKILQIHYDGEMKDLAKFSHDARKALGNEKYTDYLLRLSYED